MRIYGIVGWKNAGKTGLMERLVAEITGRGVSVSTVKHAHHVFDVDQPGKDSYRHREAGAHEVFLASRKRIALMQELRNAAEPTLADLLARMVPVDLVLVEGYKRDAHPKIEAFRAETGNVLIADGDPTIHAVASDVAVELDRPVFDLDATGEIADFILAEVGLVKLAQTPALRPPPLRDDCFALPAGVDWTPVDDALALLRARLHPVVAAEPLPSEAALGRVLAAPVVAARANPPQANTAVDGYGFAHASLGEGDQVLPLVQGRAAAGVPFPGRVPACHAVRVLTGAALPDGVDTVILQEDVTLGEGAVAFRPGIRAGANTRKAGEDVMAGDTVLTPGRLLTPADLALISAIGGHEVQVFAPLKVAVLSTGDELLPPGQPAAPGQIYDANRPMLSGLVRKLGHEPVDLGIQPDDRDQLRATFDRAAGEADVILTSGGASSGDEDHVSALLNEAGAMAEWRIALKPGRPLALGMWHGTPVFGLPGNPVAALVCTLIFAAPAMRAMSGAGWQEPQGFMVPAAFEKSKKPGRREYLRARIRDGRAEVFASEGSGRISGLSWAEGLVELGDAAASIRPGDPVRYIPFASFC